MPPVEVSADYYAIFASNRSTRPEHHLVRAVSRYGTKVNSYPGFDVKVGGCVMATGMWLGRNRYRKHALLEHLLRVEPRLRRHRDRVLFVIAAIMTMIAVADLRLWPGISLAFGYSIPIALGAYALGIRVGVALSVLGVVLRRIFAGRTYGAWWLYGGSALMLSEYLLLAIGVGLLGRAVARLERQTRTLRHLGEFGRNLTTLRDPDAIWRAGVEGAVRLTGAEGGFIATQLGAVWRTTTVYRRAAWHEQTFVWLPDSTPARHPGDTAAIDTDPARRQLEAPLQIGAPLDVPGGGSARQLVVFRSIHGPFTPATAEILTLAALHMTTALYAASFGAAPSVVSGTAGANTATEGIEQDMVRRIFPVDHIPKTPREGDDT